MGITFVGKNLLAEEANSSLRVAVKEKQVNFFPTKISTSVFKYLTECWKGNDLCKWRDNLIPLLTGSNMYEFTH